MDDSFEERLAAVERGLTDGEVDCSALADAAVTSDRVSGLEDDLADLEDRVAELEAATQALRGYVGSVRSVNDDVEQRADAAIAKAEAARRAVEGTSPRNRDTDARSKDGHDKAYDDETCPNHEHGDDRPGSERETGEAVGGNHATTSNDSNTEFGSRCDSCGAPRQTNSGRLGRTSNQSRLDRLDETTATGTAVRSPDSSTGGLDSGESERTETIANGENAGLLARIRDMV